MDFDNKTVIIVCATAIGVTSAALGNMEIPLAVASGLVGYLSHDIGK